MNHALDCIETEVTSITTGKPQTLYIDGKDRELLAGKRALIADDVISTGNTLRGMRQLLNIVGAKIVGEMAVFTEGDESHWPDVIALGNLPVFTD